MHESIRDFLSRMKVRFPAFRGRVVEFGSYDINGTPRPFFEPGTDYRGLDWRAGPAVDVVCIAHEYSPLGKFDTVISTSMLEHDPHWEASLRRMVHVLKPGGSLLVTAAGVGFPVHELHTAPPALGVENHYRGITVKDVVENVLFLRDFEEVVAEEDEQKMDVRCFFHRSKEEA